MIYSILKKNTAFSFFFIAIAIIVLWLLHASDATIIEYSYDTYPMPLYSIAKNIVGTSSTYQTIATVLLLIINLIFLVQLNSRYRLLENRTTTYIFLFAIFSSFLPHFMQFNPVLCASICLLYAIISLFKLYKNERELRAVFEAGVCISLASLFYAPALFLLLFAFAAIFTLVPFNWRQWLLTLCGMLLPYAILFSITFLTDSTAHTLASIIESFTSKPLHYELTLFTYTAIAIIAFIFILSSFYALSGRIKKVMLKRYYFLLFTLMVYVVLIYFLIPSAGIEFFVFALVPLSIFIAQYIAEFRRLVFSELVLLLIVLLKIAYFFQ